MHTSATTHIWWTQHVVVNCIPLRSHVHTQSPITFMIGHSQWFPQLPLHVQQPIVVYDGENYIHLINPELQHLHYVYSNGLEAEDVVNHRHHKTHRLSTILQQLPMALSHLDVGSLLQTIHLHMVVVRLRTETPSATYKHSINTRKTNHWQLSLPQLHLYYSLAVL